MEWTEMAERSMKIVHDKVRESTTGFKRQTTCDMLQGIYQKNTFSKDRRETHAIFIAVHESLTLLTYEIGKQDSRFAGRLEGIGSFFDGTRVGEAPNEFDYLYILTEMVSSVRGCQTKGIGKYSCQVHRDHDFGNGSQNLSNILVRDTFSYLIDKSVKSMKLPYNLQHGGISSPFFSGVRKNGPAFTFVFLWTGGEYRVYDPLLITVDLTVALRPAHLQTFLEEEQRFAEALQPIQSFYASDLYLIAHPDQDDVWQTTTGTLEVAILSKFQPRMRTIVMLLKILKDSFLTVRECSDNSSTDKLIRRQQRVGTPGIRKKMETLVKHARHVTEREPRNQNIRPYHVNVGTTGIESFGEDVDIKSGLICTSAARLLCCTSTNGWQSTSGKDQFSEICMLQRELFSLFLQNERTRKPGTDHRGVSVFEDKGLSREGPIQLEETDTLGSLDYLPDFLPPHLSRLAFEDCKPLVTLKSCIFKYVLIKLSLAGKVPQSGPEDGFDMDLLLLVLREIRESKQVQHPLLGHSIQTYSISHRVYNCAAGQDLQRSLDIGNRLSDILYGFLDVIIQALEGHNG